MSFSGEMIIVLGPNDLQFDSFLGIVNLGLETENSIREGKLDRHYTNCGMSRWDRGYCYLGKNLGCTRKSEKGPLFWGSVLSSCFLIVGFDHDLTYQCPPCCYKGDFYLAT